jgi:hypothetical protein
VVEEVKHAMLGRHAPHPTPSSARSPLWPAPARRYADFIGLDARANDSNVRFRVAGVFRTDPRGGWMKAEAWQVTSSDDVARIFVMRAWLANLFPIVARDTYVRGHGRLRVDVLRYWRLVDSEAAEISIGELSTYLTEIVLLLPGALLRPGISIHAVDASTFRVAIEDCDHDVSVEVSVSPNGAVRSVTTNDRFLNDPYSKRHPLVPRRWTVPVTTWQTVQGRRIPSRLTAIWQLPQGPFRYIDMALDPSTASFNIDLANH